MRLEFTKMHGCGNDYIYLDCLTGMIDNAPELSRLLSPRRFSVGSDGLICIAPSGVADATMRMFNADGSESAMCGNGIRCVAQWLYEHGVVGDEVTIETLAGVKHLSRKGEGVWQVEMGRAEFEPALVPVKDLGPDPVINRAIAVEGHPWQVTAISMGNPHCVTVVDDVQALDLERIGPGFENHPAFPEHVNTEFIQVMGKNHLAMRVWERGSGETLACGTGACAAAAASVMLRLCDAGADIALDLPGGRLTIRVDEDWQIRMTGPAKTVYTGVVEV